MFANVFDEIGRVPGEGEGELVFEEDGEVRDGDEEVDDAEEEEEGPSDGAPGRGSEWRKTQPKRLLMAIVDEDSTVVYYIVHDGVVKPRQN